MSLIDIKEHLIQEIKWLKFQIDCVENEEEENEKENFYQFNWI